MHHSSATPAIHIFNPETDLALACGRESYTPPARILALRRRLALLPALWAASGDIIAVDASAGLPFHPDTDNPDSGGTEGTHRNAGLPLFPTEDELISAAETAVSTIGLKVLPLEIAVRQDGEINPWGWNPELRCRLIRFGADTNTMPSAERIAALRELAHRRKTIEFHTELHKRGWNQMAIPVEASSEAELKVAILELGPACFLKAPWSSSGRGIHYLADCYDRKQVQKAVVWGLGSIARQGSVMVEKAEDRLIDFASEWDCTPEGPIFKGWSVFRTAASGGYGGNAWAPQARIEHIIKEAIPNVDLDGLVDLQRQCLSSMHISDYAGPIGIDMLATHDGRINACVETNIRMTMGRAAAEWAKSSHA